MKLLNSLAIVILLMSGCTEVQKPRNIPGLALATVIEKAIDPIDGRYILRLSSVDADFVDARTPANPFVIKIILSAYASEGVYNEVEVDDRVVLAYKNEVTEHGVGLQRVWIIRKRVNTAR